MRYIFLFNIIVLVAMIPVAIREHRITKAPSVRFIARGMVMIALGSLLNLTPAAFFPKVEWLRITGAILGMIVMVPAFALIWRALRSQKSRETA